MLPMIFPDKREKFSYDGINTNQLVGIMNYMLLLLTVLLVFIIPQPVSAYLDPGFGSMVWQVMAAVAFSAVFTIKIYWQKIKNFFGRSKMNKPQE